MRLIVVEDNSQDMDLCKQAADEHPIDIDIVEARSLEEASSELNPFFDGAIIDLKLGQQNDGGNSVIEEIKSHGFRIPVIVTTGTPDSIEASPPVIEIMKKGEFEYKEVLDILSSIYKTGMTKIMGGRGKIEETLERIFFSHLLKHKDIWISYAEENQQKTERGLLRHTLEHLLQSLVEDEQHFPEEMYIFPPLIGDVQTGRIVQEKNPEQYYVVMNPACDLIHRGNNNRNTDRILLAEIEPITERLTWFDDNDENLSQNRQNEMKKVFGNNKSSLHGLPRTDFFDGGFINFQKLSTVTFDDFRESFHKDSEIQIAPSFVKDIVSRFSSYYARQGQPEIDLSKYIGKGS